MTSKRRTQTELALLVGYKGRQGLTNLLTRKGLGAEPEYAKALARLTDSDPFLWLKGGDLSERRQEVKLWTDNPAVSLN